MQFTSESQTGIANWHAASFEQNSDHYGLSNVNSYEKILQKKSHSAILANSTIQKQNNLACS